MLNVQYLVIFIRLYFWPPAYITLLNFLYYVSQWVSCLRVKLPSYFASSIKRLFCCFSLYWRLFCSVHLVRYICVIWILICLAGSVGCFFCWFFGCQVLHFVLHSGVLWSGSLPGTYDWVVVIKRGYIEIDTPASVHYMFRRSAVNFFTLF